MRVCSLSGVSTTPSWSENRILLRRGHFLDIEREREFEIWCCQNDGKFLFFCLFHFLTCHIHEKGWSSESRVARATKTQVQVSKKDNCIAKTNLFPLRHIESYACKLFFSTLLIIAYALFNCIRLKVSIFNSLCVQLEGERFYCPLIFKLRSNCFPWPIRHEDRLSKIGHLFCCYVKKYLCLVVWVLMDK